MGDEDKICVDEESEGGVNLSVSTWPRCIRAVRLSDAFCLRMTRLDIPDSLFDVCGTTAVSGLMSGDPWKEEEERAHVCIGIKNKEAVEIIPRRTALLMAN